MYLSLVVTFEGSCARRHRSCVGTVIELPQLSEIRRPRARRIDERGRDVERMDPDHGYRNAKTRVNVRIHTMATLHTTM